MIHALIDVPFWPIVPGWVSHGVVLWIGIVIGMLLAIALACYTPPNSTHPPARRAKRKGTTTRERDRG